MLATHGEALNSGDANEAGVALAHLYIKDIEEPVGARDIDRVTRSVVRYQTLPPKVTNDEAGDIIASKLEAWATSIGSKTSPAAAAQLSLLELAQDYASKTMGTKLRKQQASTKLQLANSIASDWPTLALEYYLDLADNSKAIASGKPIVETLTKQPALLLEAKTIVTLWAERAKQIGDLADSAKRATDLIKTSQSTLEKKARKHALDSGKHASVAAWLKQNPWDQQAAVVLAEISRSQGKASEAVAILTKFGKPGWLVSSGQQTLAAAYAETDQLEKADAMLTKIVETRRPRYQRLRREFEAKADALWNRMTNRLQSGNIPPELRPKISNTQDPEETRKIVDTWMTEKIRDNTQLAQLRANYERHADVIGLSLTLGMVKLQRANAASKTDRAKLLTEAELAFLAIRQDAEGHPSYHLGLGEVYHRLGKTKQGDLEFQGLLDRKQPPLNLQVARSYRRLRLVEKARQIAESTWTSSTGDDKNGAAMLLGVMADELDDKEKWFKRANTSSPDVRIALLEVTASRQYRDGNFAKADANFAKAAEHYKQEAAHNPISANNTAIAYVSRYDCTGDEKHLSTAARFLEKSYLRSADNALVTANLSSVLEHLGSVRTLNKWVRAPILRLSKSDASLAVITLATGPIREKFVAALRSEPNIRRTIELTKHQILLAPQAAQGYQQAVSWHVILENRDKLAALRNQLQGWKRADAANLEEEREKWFSGSEDKKTFDRLRKQIKRLEASLKDAKSHSHKPTAAVAWYVLGVHQKRLAKITENMEQLDEAMVSLRKSYELWPQMGAHSSLAQALVLRSLRDTKKKSTVITKLWNDNRRRLNTEIILHRIFANSDANRVIRTHNDVIEAGRLLAPDTTQRPAEMLSWIIGTGIGNSQLVSFGQQAMTGTKRLETETNLLLDPQNPTAKAHWELVSGAEKPRTSPLE